MTHNTASPPWFRPIRPSRPDETAPLSQRQAEAVNAAATPDTTRPPEAQTGLDGLIHQATDAATFLKALGHDGRLTIMCHLMSGPKSVTELENLLSMRQAVVSQQLARLRLEGLVSARREGQAIFYSILDPKVADMLGVLGYLFRMPDRAPD